ncbi:hypothetical protein SRHO_G00164550 [Serrasalmus rhombeus]
MQRPFDLLRVPSEQEEGESQGDSAHVKGICHSCGPHSTTYITDPENGLKDFCLRGTSQSSPGSIASHTVVVNKAVLYFLLLCTPPSWQPQTGLAAVTQLRWRSDGEGEGRQLASSGEVAETPP